MAKRDRDIHVRPPAEDSPRLDVFAHGALLDIMERFRERLIEEASRLARDNLIDGNDLEQAFEVLFATGSQTEWSVANRRRLYLIRRHVSGAISPAESAELAELQARADRHMQQVAPRPLEALWKLESELNRMPDAETGGEGSGVGAE